MSYQVLARRWRPTNFAETVGQEPVLRALSNALNEQRVHHAYLFSGTRGVGKTTVARIVAKCLNCEEGISALACGNCRACKEIDEGRFVDLIEVDAASRTKVDDTRELLDNVQYAPSLGRYKVYLIDEVHMLSTQSFNALLKTLEEPPAHVQFLLATTDPQKLPATVLSRCVQFHLRKLSVEQIQSHLARILDEENVSSEPLALLELARAAEGSIRDALSLTDQAIALGGGRISEEDTRVMLGCTNRVQMLALADSLIRLDAPAVLDSIEALDAHAPDFERVLADLLSILHRISIAQHAPAGLDDGLDDKSKILDWASQISSEDLQLFYQIGVHGRRDFPYVPEPRGALEMILLRMLAFRPQQKQPAESLRTKELDRAADAEAAASIKKPRSQDAPKLGASSTDIAWEGERKTNPELELGDEAALGRSSEADEALSAVTPSADTPSPSGQAAKTLADAESELDVDWIALFGQLSIRGVAANIAANCVLESVTGDCFCFLLDERRSSLYNPECDGRLATALSSHFDRPVTVEIRQGRLTAESPAARLAQSKDDAQRLAEQAIDSDPQVRLLLERFSGTLHRDSITPICTPVEGQDNEGT